MAVKVDPPPQNIPGKLKLDSELSPYFTYLNKFNRDMWLRSGGGDDQFDGTAHLAGTETFTGAKNFSLPISVGGVQVVATQQGAIADIAGATATNPTAPAVYVAHSSGATPVTSNAATDLDTTAAALQSLRDSVANYEATISALVVDVADMRSKMNVLLSELRTHGLIAT